MRIETCTEAMLEEWLALRLLLWPDEDAGNPADGLRILRNPGAVTFLARDDGGRAIGFAEATLRRDYVNGCTTSPVGFLEGLYVREDWRRQGVARGLCQAVEAWTKARGASELASDTWLDSVESQHMHQALGFSKPSGWSISGRLWIRVTALSPCGRGQRKRAFEGEGSGQQSKRQRNPIEDGVEIRVQFMIGKPHDPKTVPTEPARTGKVMG